MGRKQVDINDIVELWVPHDGQPLDLDEQIRRAREKGKMVVVYRSGHADLAEQTSELLRYNRNIAAGQTESGSTR